jgi:photosystem II stability/assembly factor-like uncharacterized protein
MGATLLTSAVYDVGTNSAIFASGDFGRTWSSPEATAAPNEPISTFAKTANSVFAAGSNHIFRSTTRGKRWVALKTPFKGAITALETPPQTGGVLLASHAELFLSSDEGTRWLNIELPSAITGIRLLRFSPDGRTWGIGTRDSVFLSSDKGATWSKVATPEQHGTVYDFAINTRNTILIGTLRGVAISLDAGLHWRIPTQGISPGTVDSVLWHPLQKNLMYAVQHGLLYKSSDAGTIWERIKTDELGSDSILDLHWASDHSKLYAVTFARGIFVQNLSLANSVATGGSDH